MKKLFDLYNARFLLLFHSKILFPFSRKGNNMVLLIDQNDSVEHGSELGFSCYYIINYLLTDFRAEKKLRRTIPY